MEDIYGSLGKSCAFSGKSWLKVFIWASYIRSIFGIVAFSVLPSLTSVSYDNKAIIGGIVVCIVLLGASICLSLGIEEKKFNKVLILWAIVEGFVGQLYGFMFVLVQSILPQNHSVGFLIYLGYWWQLAFYYFMAHNIKIGIKAGRELAHVIKTRQNDHRNGGAFE